MEHLREEEQMWGAGPHGGVELRGSQAGGIELTRLKWGSQALLIVLLCGR